MRGTNPEPFALFHRVRLSSTYPMIADRAPAGYKSRPGTARLDLTRRIPATVVRKPPAPKCPRRFRCVIVLDHDRYSFGRADHHGLTVSATQSTCCLLRPA